MMPLWVYVCVSISTVRSGYRLKASQDQDSMKVLYYVEKELGQFPSTKMAALKRKAAQIRPVSVICVWQCESVYVFVSGLSVPVLSAWFVYIK